MKAAAGRHRVALVGFGAIAQRQHRPSIAASPRFELAAVADPAYPKLEGVPVYGDLPSLLAGTTIDAVAICTPPNVRAKLAGLALAAGKHVLLEKPPTATLAEAEALAALAGPDRTLFAAWHSRFNAAVDHAAALLANRKLRSVEVVWTEHVDDFHAGQDWIWQPDGFGVFDPGINAVSILTRILPGRLAVRSVDRVPGPGGTTPIAATILGRLEPSGASVSLMFDWRVRAIERVLRLVCDDGTTFELGGGGRVLIRDGVILVDEPKDEYRRIYGRWAELIDAGRSEIDLEPLRIIAEAAQAG